MRSVWARFALIVATLGLASAPAAAQSEEDQSLSRSELIAPERARAVEPITLTFVLRSDTDERGPVVCRVELDDQVLFAGQAGDSVARFNQSDRMLVWEGELPARGEARFSFDVIAPAWMAYYGFDVVASAHRPDALVGITRRTIVGVDEARRTSRPAGVRVGPIIVGPYEAVLLAAVIATIVLGFSIRQRVSRYVLPGTLAAFLGLTVVAGLFLIDGARAVLDDVQILRTWQPTRATVIDAAPVHVPGSSSGVRRKGNPSRTMAPLAVVRYQAGGTSRVAIGFWSDSHIFVSRRAARAVAPYVAGKTVTCWVDPARPWRFVLVRAPGFGHLFLAGLLAVIGGVVWLAVRIGRSLQARA